MKKEIEYMMKTYIDRETLPEYFPTHRHTPEFWEKLERTIATFGFLEEILGKAIFAFTATRPYSPDELEQAYEQWIPKLEKALTDQLWNLAESFGKAVQDHPESTIENIDELVNDIKEATVYRNALCHGSWQSPDDEGKSLPLFIRKNNEKFETPIDINLLNEIQSHALELSCLVIESVTQMGWKFPGSSGPGKTIWK